VSHYSRKRRPFVKIGLWILVGMIVLGLLGSTLAWYLGSDSGQQPITETPSSEEDMFTSEIEKQEALREQYEEMLANKPEDLTILTGYARVEMGLGELYLQNQEESLGKEAFQRAATLYQKALEKENDLQLRLELASAYQLLSDDSKAEEELNKVLEQDPGNINALAQKGILLESREDWDEAVKAWESVADSPQADEMTKEIAEARIKAIKEQE
jgi:cytochrome c-type biogenesis protein CcmH/NrfG